MALAVWPIKDCSTIAELRWWVEPFLIKKFAVAAPMFLAVDEDGEGA